MDLQSVGWLALPRRAVCRWELSRPTALVTAALGGPLHPHAAKRLWELTRGNVLYLRNIVDQVVADERLALYNGLWRQRYEDDSDTG